jgi:hypothetical protein
MAFDWLRAVLLKPRSSLLSSTAHNVTFCVSGARRRLPRIRRCQHKDRYFRTACRIPPAARVLLLPASRQCTRCRSTILPPLLLHSTLVAPRSALLTAITFASRYQTPFDLRSPCREPAPLSFTQHTYLLWRVTSAKQSNL